MAESSELTPKTPERPKAFSGNIREYFHQNPLEINPRQTIEKIADILKETTIDNYRQKQNELKDWYDSLYEQQKNSFVKTPPLSSNQDKAEFGKTKRRRKETRQAYRQEIRNGVKAIIDMEDCWRANPDITPEALIARFFSGKDGKLVPRADLTNEQTFFLLVNNLQYFLDHEVLTEAKKKYQDDAVLVAKELYGIDKLKHPKQARVIWNKDVGLVLALDKEDWKKSGIANCHGFYLNGSRKLNSQLIGMENDRPPADEKQILDHEYDHLLFFKYRTVKSRFSEDPPEIDQKRRLLSDPFSMEIILGSQKYAEIKELIGTEIGAYLQAGEVFNSNHSVDLQRQHSEMTRKLFPETVLPADINSPFVSLMALDRLSAKLVEPILREELYLRYYHAMDICVMAVEQGVSAREVSVALAILGPDKIDHLQALCPNLNVKRYPTAGLAINSYPEIPIPFSDEYVRQYDTKYQGLRNYRHSLEKKQQRREDRTLYNLRYQPKKAALERYLADHESYVTKKPRREKTEIDMTNRETICISVGKAVFENLSDKFFSNIQQADSPFHPVFQLGLAPKENCDYYTPEIARMIKTAITEGRKFTTDNCQRLLKLRKEKNIYRFEEATFWESWFYPAVWALTAFPQDKEIVTGTINMLLLSEKYEGGKSKLDLATQHKTIVENVVWKIFYLGFFYEYRQTRLNNKLSEEQKQQKLGDLLKNYSRLL